MYGLAKLAGSAYDDYLEWRSEGDELGRLSLGADYHHLKQKTDDERQGRRVGGAIGGAVGGLAGLVGMYSPAARRPFLHRPILAGGTGTAIGAAIGGGASNHTFGKRHPFLEGEKVTMDQMVEDHYNQFDEQKWNAAMEEWGQQPSLIQKAPPVRMGDV